MKLISEQAPIFPCWLYQSAQKYWERYEEDIWDGRLAGYGDATWWTHWHPDQPTAPTSSPGETGGEAKPSVFNPDLLTRCIMGQAEMQIFKTQARKSCVKDDETGLVVTAYIHPDGRILLADIAPEQSPRAAQSQTPMTDLAEKFGIESDACDFVRVSFARTLETALAAAKERGDSEERMRRTMETRHGEVLADCHSMRMLKDEVLKSWHDVTVERDTVRAQLEARERIGNAVESDLRTRLAALQQQVGEDTYCVDMSLMLERCHDFAVEVVEGKQPQHYTRNNASLLLGTIEMHGPKYAAAHGLSWSPRLARQPDQRQGEGS